MLKKIFIIAIVALFTFSCEKVIDLPLNKADQKIVIEAVASNFQGESYVLLSKTGTVYEQSVFEKINNATITITDVNGVVSVFNEDGTSSGKYVNAAFVVEENNEYLLSVVADDETYTAKSETATMVPLDFLFAEKEAASLFGPGGGDGKDSVNILYFGFVDNINETNFYRFRVSINGERTGDLYLGDDKLINGQDFIQPFYLTSFDDGDTVFVEMINMDKANYDYFYSMANAQDQSAFSATPANPVSNIESNSLGYFGAYLVDTMTIVIP